MPQIIESNVPADMDIETIFQELGENHKIMIDRKEPEWCSGHMRTLYFNPDETISLDWIQKKFGGERYQIKLYGPPTAKHKNGYMAARTVSIFGPPMDGHGIEITQGPDGKPVKINELAAAIERHNKKMGILKEPDPVAPPAPAAPSPLQDQALVQTLITSQGEQNRLMMQMMSERVQSLEEMLYRQKPAPPGGPAVSPLDQFKQTAEAISMIDTIRDSIGAGSAGAGGEESVIPMVSDLVKALVTGRNQAPEQPARGALREPAQRRPRTLERPRARRTDDDPAPALRPVQPEDDDSLLSIADKLSSLHPDDAAECVIEAMGKMNERQRAAAMQAFITNMNEDSQLDESTIDEDNYSQDESFSDPFSPTHDSQTSIPRQQPNPNAQNDPANRPGDPARVEIPSDTEPRRSPGNTGTK